MVSAILTIGAMVLYVVSQMISLAKGLQIPKPVILFVVVKMGNG